MGKQYAQLTAEERVEIYRLHAEGGSASGASVARSRHATWVDGKRIALYGFTPSLRRKVIMGHQSVNAD